MQISEQDLREGIGSELADILHRQKAIVAFNESLKMSGKHIREEFRTMAEDDENSVRMLETVIGSFGIRLQPKASVLSLTSSFAEIIGDDDATPIEKLGVYILIKQQQMMSSHLVHKSTQLSQPDIKAAVGPFDGVYATVSKHVGTLVSIMEKSGVAWITGKEPATGFMGRARDAFASVSGAIFAKTFRPADEMPIFDVLKMDHRKVEVLFKEIEGASDQNLAIDIFKQLKADLTAHSIAEEQTVYAQFANISDMQRPMADAETEHEELRLLLDELSEITGDREQFRNKLNELKGLVQHHVSEEEGKIFDMIENHSSETQRVQLSQDFLKAKQNIQENVGTSEVVASAGLEDEGSRSPSPQPEQR